MNKSLFTKLLIIKIRNKVYKKDNTKYAQNNTRSLNIINVNVSGLKSRLKMNLKSYCLGRKNK